jgi:membrane dipeptidase
MRAERRAVYRIFDALNGSRITREYVEKALAHGLSVIHVTVNNFSTIRPYPTLAEALSELAAIRAHYSTLDDVALVVHSAADFDMAANAGKLGVVLGYQNVPGVDSDLRMLELFAALGVRCIQISHNRRGPYAGGCADEVDEGLSPLGRELIAELNRLRIVIDLSHTGDRSTLEGIELSTGPVCITHANAAAVCANPRNKSDNVLDALGRNGGVIGLCYLTPLVRMNGDPPTPADFEAHLRHVRDRIGMSHVGIGSDFIEGQPAERYQEFLRNPQVYGTWPWRFPITDLAHQQAFLTSLREAGFSDEEVSAFAGANFLRVFQNIIE